MKDHTLISSDRICTPNRMRVHSSYHVRYSQPYDILDLSNMGLNIDKMQPPVGVGLLDGIVFSVLIYLYIYLKRGRAGVDSFLSSYI